MSDSDGKGFALKVTESVADAVSFDRILVTGFLGILAVILLISAILTIIFGTENKETVSYSLALYKDIALILVGALANSVMHKNNTEGK